MPIAAAGISAGASILGGVTSGKGAETAAKINAAAYQKGIDETARQFNTTQSNIQPDVNAGNSALQQMLRLLGLGDSNTGVSVNGNPALSASDQQTGALANLKQSPLFTGAYDTGADTILQNASATGGLRGGNTENSLAQFGSSLFAQTLQQQLANLGSLVSNGSGAASGLGRIGQDSASSTAGLLAKQGQSEGAAAAAPYGMLSSIFNGLGSAANSYLGGGGNGSSLGSLPSSEAFDAAYHFSKPQGW